MRMNATEPLSTVWLAIIVIVLIAGGNRPKFHHGRRHRRSSDPSGGSCSERQVNVISIAQREHSPHNTACETGFFRVASAARLLYREGGSSRSAPIPQESVIRGHRRLDGFSPKLSLASAG